MRFYNQQHSFYCGVDLHTRTMHICILDPGGQKVLHQGLLASPLAFLTTIAPYRLGLVVAAECLFSCPETVRRAL
jgi:hypothetical protein